MQNLSKKKLIAILIPNLFLFIFSIRGIIKNIGISNTKVLACSGASIIFISFWILILKKYWEGKYDN